MDSLSWTVRDSFKNLTELALISCIRSFYTLKVACRVCTVAREGCKLYLLHLRGYLILLDWFLRNNWWYWGFLRSAISCYVSFGLLDTLPIDFIDQLIEHLLFLNLEMIIIGRFWSEIKSFYHSPLWWLVPFVFLLFLCRESWVISITLERRKAFLDIVVWVVRWLYLFIIFFLYHSWVWWQWAFRTYVSRSVFTLKRTMNTSVPERSIRRVKAYIAMILILSLVFHLFSNFLNSNNL